MKISGNNTRAHLAYGVLTLASLIIIGLFFIEMPQSNRDLLNTALGFVAGWASAVVSYYFASAEVESITEKDSKDESS